MLSIFLPSFGEPLQFRCAGRINDAEKAIFIQSPKTKNYDGHESWIVTFWPEIADKLDRLYYEAEPKHRDDLIFPMLQPKAGKSPKTVNCRMRKTAVRIRKKAGLPHWEKFFQNMRASRVTEAKQIGYTADQRTAWFGHDESVSKEHYQMKNQLVTTEDRKQATTFRTPSNLMDGVNAGISPESGGSSLLGCGR